MTTTATPEEQEAARKAAKAQKERERRARIKAEKEAAAGNGGTPSSAPDPKAIAERAREIAPEVKTPFRAATAESLLVILEGGDPLASVALTEGELAGREPRQVILGFARGALEASDPAAGALRAQLRELGKDPRGKHLWGRKAAALLVAASDLAKG